MPLDIVAGPGAAARRNLADTRGTAPGADACVTIAGDAIGEATFSVADDFDGNVLRRFGQPGLETVTHQFGINRVQGRSNDFLEKFGIASRATVCG